MDATGRVIIERNCRNISTINIDTQKLPKEIYYVILPGNAESVSGRFLK